MNSKILLLGSLSLVFGLFGVNVAEAIARSSNGTSWRGLSRIGDPTILALIPSRFLAGFENGDVAVTALNSYRTAYVVAKNGVNLKTTSIASIQANQGRNLNLSFNNPEAFNKGYSLPATLNFPESRYEASQLIEVVHYAAKYDGQSTRTQARQSSKANLSNRRSAYYLRQDSGRQGWCVFTNELERYSDFTCVNIANSPKAALTVLDSLPTKN